MKVLARIAASLVAVTVVWLVCPRAALAAAPLCDARGAIMFAPPPTLDEPNTSIDVGDNDDCSSTTRAIDVALKRGQSPSAADASQDLARAALSAPIVVLAPTATATAVDVVAHFAAPRGVRARVDRPPR